jgi:hypothetical protein
MTKKEAVEKFVETRLSAVPTEWVKKVAEGQLEDAAWPMWGDMWFMEWDYESLEKFTKEMTEENFGDDFDEDMDGQPVFVDDGKPTSFYLYEVDGRVLIGVHAAGFSFYDGVWDVLYDILGLKWHDEE